MKRRKLLIVDDAPFFGGAWTSLQAFIDTTSRRAWDVQVAPRSMQMEAFVQRPGVQWLGSNLSTSTSRSALDAVRTARMLRDDVAAADVVLLNNTPNANLSGAIAASWGQTPTVHWVRGLVGRSRLAWRTLQRSSAVFTVGPDVTAQLRQRGVRAHLVNEGLSDAQMPALRNPDANDWLFAAAPVAWKGLDLVLDAHQRLWRQGHARRLWVCGQHRPQRVPPGVVFVDDPCALDDVRQRCRVFIHGATQAEPFGRVLLEALAAGLHVVAPDDIGSRQALSGCTGLALYEARSVEHLVSALLHVERLAPVEPLVPAAFTADEAFSAVWDELRAAVDPEHNSATLETSRCERRL